MADAKFILRTATFCIILVSFVLCIIATCTNYWSQYHNKNFGLWRVCNGSHCENIRKETDTLHTVQAFILLACLAHFLAFVYVGVLHCKRSLSIKILGVVMLLACVFSVIAMAVYTGMKGRVAGMEWFSWSYALGWVTAVLSLVAAMICFNMRENYQPV